VKWLRKAAEQNHAGAQFNLGVGYAYGQGVVKDALEAVKWYRKAAEVNHAKAQTNLGVCYLNGEGVAKDEVEAYKWFLLGATHGDENAKTNMAIQESRLTREQIAEGQKRARNFKPREVPSTGGRY
jgi:TPR repeat protein